MCNIVDSGLVLETNRGVWQRQVCVMQGEHVA